MTAGAVVYAYLADQVAVILRRDAEVRRGEPDAVHKSRVATRRLRSSLSTFRPLFDREITDPIRAELKWLAGSLGRVRDIEVQRAHLLEAVAAEPPDLVMGPVQSRIEVELGSDLRVAREKLLEDLESARYFRLLDTLDDLIARPPFNDHADAKPRAVLDKRVRAATRRLRGLVRGGPLHGSSEDHWLHEIRKAAKRVRYAAEAAASVLGRRAALLAADAEQMQETLGAHQDSVGTRSTLRGIAVRSHLDGENAFTTGRLHALEQARAKDSRDDFLRAWSSDYARRLKDWRRS
jgi:CHAD domain-containing protein